MTRDEDRVLPDIQGPQRRSRYRSASLDGLEQTKEVVPPPSKIFCLDRTRSRELRGWMTSQLKSAESKQIGEDFVP
jgi:hypothetical protein